MSRVVAGALGVCGSGEIVFSRRRIRRCCSISRALRPIAIPSPSPSCHATLCSRIEIHAAQSSTTLRRQVVVDSYTGGFPEIRMLQCSIRLASTLTRCTLQRLVVNQELMNGSQHQTQIPEIPVPAFDYPTTTTARSQLRGRNSNSVNILSSLITDPPPFLYWHQSSSAAEIFAASQSLPFKPRIICSSNGKPLAELLTV